jgi:dTDP-4-dehydrorhamnose 3,5-epimerase
VLDVTVDIRVGSPTFGAWDGVRLSEGNGSSVYLAEGLGHAFYALTEDAAVSYFCSEPYNPRAEHCVHALDPAIGIQWPTDVPPVLSPRDAEAMSLDEAREAGILPDYERCRQYYADARSHAREAAR